MKPSTTQNCSTAYKYAQHLLLTNKKSLRSRQPTCMNKSSYDRERQRKITVFSTALLSAGSQEKRRSLLAWPTAVADVPQRWQRTGLTAEGTKQWGLSTRLWAGREALGVLQGKAGGITAGRGEEGTGLHRAALSRQPAACGFCLLSQRLRVNSVCLAEGKSLLPFTLGFRIIVSLRGRVRRTRLVWKWLTRRHHGTGGSIFNIFKWKSCSRFMPALCLGGSAPSLPRAAPGTSPQPHLPQQPHYPAAEPPPRQPGPALPSHSPPPHCGEGGSERRRSAPLVAQLRSRRRPAVGWRTRCLWPRSGEICHHPAGIPHFPALGQPLF